MPSEADRQLELLGRRAVDWVSPEELRARLEAARAEGRPLRVKYGADPSAPDLHLGHVVGLNKLREFQDLGHTVVFIVGDFTARIGDPSGRSQTRRPLSAEEVRAHAETYQAQVFRVLDPARTEVRYNSEWLGAMRFEDVIRLSAQATVAQMLAREDFAQRFRAQQPISLVEFLYPLVQAYDSVVVRADVELGGTDQLFNLLLGRELQKSFGQPPQTVLTLPLLEGLDGAQKMSKSLGNTVGVTEPPEEVFGKLMSVSDGHMWRFFDLVLCEPPERLAALRADVAAGRAHPRAVKEEMARRIAARFHGASAARAAAEAFARVFSRHENPEAMPEVGVTAAEAAGGGLRMVELLVRAGLAESRGAARRLITQGAVRLDDRRVDDALAAPPLPDGAVLRAGRRRFARIRVGA